MMHTSLVQDLWPTWGMEQVGSHGDSFKKKIYVIKGLKIILKFIPAFTAVMLLENNQWKCDLKNKQKLKPFGFLFRTGMSKDFPQNA